MTLPIQDKPAKKKLMVVNAKKGCYYAPSTVGFAFLVKPKEGEAVNNKDRTLVTETATCRERVIQLYAEYYNNVDAAGLSKENFNKFDGNRVRLVTPVNPSLVDEHNFKNTKERIFMSKAILNLYEKYAGFDPTKVSTINFAYEFTESVGESVTKKLPAWLFTGGKDGGWFKSPAIFSYMCLIIRISLKLQFKILEKLSNLDNIEMVHKEIDSLFENGESFIPISGVNDNDINIYLRDTYKYILTILKNHDFLYEGIAPSPKLNSSEARDFRSRGGIYSLCKRKSYLPILNERMEKLFGGPLPVKAKL
jgi:hypothetical protein